MPIDYSLSKVVIKGFRGIAELTLDLRDGYPSVLIGANNAGKSTILNAIALALNGGGYHQWTPAKPTFTARTTAIAPLNFWCRSISIRSMISAIQR